jgi:hypothetical protein
MYFLSCYFSLVDWCYQYESVRNNNVSEVLLNEWSIITDVLFSLPFKTLILPPMKGWKDMYYLNWCKVTGHGTLPARGGGTVLRDEVGTPIYVVIYHFCFIGVTRASARRTRRASHKSRPFSMQFQVFRRLFKIQETLIIMNPDITEKIWMCTVMLRH